MKQRQYSTRDEIIGLLKTKGFKESSASNKNSGRWFFDDGQITVTLTPSAVVEIRDHGHTVAQFKQPVFDIVVTSEKLILMIGTDGNSCWSNIYIPRR